MKINTFLKFLFFIGIVSGAYAQTTPSAPVGDNSQYFCSAVSWSNGGINVAQGDVLTDLLVYGDNLTWYDDNAGSPGNVIANPSNEEMIDGEIYYVTQTVNGVESAPLAVNVVDRECGCIKNTTFETQDGMPDDSGFEFYTQSIYDGHKTCGATTINAAPLTLGTTNALTGEAVLMDDSSFDNEVVTSNLERVNPNNPYSDYALRLNDSGNSRVSHAAKDFIAGEVFVFNFAMVLEDPSNPHDYEEMPFFQVRVYDEFGNLYASRCVVSSPDDCIFDQGDTYLLYNEWSCMKINTLGLIGRKATVEFTVTDCTLGGHYGYAYIDDIFVGDEVDATCTDPSFGYVAINSVQAGSQNSNDSCVVSLGNQANASCSSNISTSLPFPMEVCGDFVMPQSSGSAAVIEDFTLDILQNNSVVGTLNNATIDNSTGTFCFTVQATDINVLPQGEFNFQVSSSYGLDCGEPYNIEIDDRTSVDVCPTAGCADPLIVCDTQGNGISTFDLTTVESQIRNSYTAADVDLSYFEDINFALDDVNEITDPTNYTNTIPNNQSIYVRLDWNPSGATGSDCFYVVEIDLIINPLPVLNLPNQVVVCAGGNAANIIATPTNIQDLQDVSYQWFRNGVQLPFTGSYYSTTQAGTYDVVVTEFDCESTATVEVLNVDFDVDLGDVNPLEVCGEDGSVVLSAEIDDNSTPAINEADLTYLWSTGETTKDITVTTAGNYSVEVSYLTCSETADIDVSVATLPNTVEIQDITKCRGEEVDVTLEVTNISAPDLEYIWYLDGGVIAGATSSTIMVEDEGTYTVEVNEIGSDFCFASEEFNVSYYANADCVITQGISPDTTPGENDCLDLEFLADRAGIENIKLYSRYGRLVFEEDDYVNTFCGQNMDGDELPTGTYYYVLVLESEDEIFDQVVKGWIYINREAN